MRTAIYGEAAAPTASSEPLACRQGLRSALPPSGSVRSIVDRSGHGGRVDRAHFRPRFQKISGRSSVVRRLVRSCDAIYGVVPLGGAGRRFRHLHRFVEAAAVDLWYLRTHWTKIGGQLAAMVYGVIVQKAKIDHGRKIERSQKVDRRKQLFRR